MPSSLRWLTLLSLLVCSTVAGQGAAPGPQRPPNPYLRVLVDADAGVDGGPVGSPTNPGNTGIWSGVDGGPSGSPTNNGNTGVYR